MAIKQFRVTLGSDEVVESTNAQAAEVTAALAVSGLSGVSGATAAVSAIGTSLGSSHVTLLVNSVGSPTKTKLRRALLAILAHIDNSNAYAT